MGHGLLCPLLVGLPPSEMDGGSLRPSRCEVSSRLVQCPGRSPQPSWASCRDGVISTPSGGGFTASCVRQPVDQPLSDEPQRESAPFLLPRSGSAGQLRGCVSSSLVGWVFAMRSPFEGRDCFMSQFSIATKTPLFSFYLVQSLRDGVTLFGSSLHCALPHSIGSKFLSEPYSKFLHDEVTLCRIVSLIPGVGVRFPFLSSRALWQRLRIPAPLLLGLRTFLYRPYQTREIIAMGDCYVLCGQSGVT